MPWIWNDPTYWERVKKSRRQDRFIVILFLVNFVAWYMYVHKITTLIAVILIAIVSTATFYSLIDIFFKFPHHKIPDTYPEWAQNLMRIGFFVIGFFILLWILQYYHIFGD